MNWRGTLNQYFDFMTCLSLFMNFILDCIVFGNRLCKPNYLFLVVCLISNLCSSFIGVLLIHTYSTFWEAKAITCSEGGD